MTLLRTALMMRGACGVPVSMSNAEYRTLLLR